jgi:hypothetical protein
MHSQGIIFGRSSVRRAVAVVAFAALLFFAAGGSFLHQHNGGPETVCHVCQSLHAPALTVSFSGIASPPQILGWHDARPLLTADLDEFSLHRSGRAPPSA